MERLKSQGPRLQAPNKKQGPRKVGPSEILFPSRAACRGEGYGVGFLAGAGAGLAGFGEAGAEAAGAPPLFTG